MKFDVFFINNQLQGGLHLHLLKCESDAVHICGNIWNTQYFYFNFWTYSSYPYILIRHEKIVKPSLVNLHYSTHHALRYFGIESSSLALKDKLIKLKSDNCGQMYFFCSLIKTPELSSPPPNTIRVNSLIICPAPPTIRIVF